MKPAVGRFRVPKIRLRVLLDHLVVLFNTFREKEFTDEEFIKILHISPSSSGATQKIYEMKQYGLIEQYNNKLHLTPIAKIIFQSDTSERQTQLIAAVQNIPLWKNFIDHGGKTIDNNTVLEVLIKDARLDEAEARQRLTEIKDAYLKDLDCVKNFIPQKDSSTKITTVINNPDQPNIDFSSSSMAKSIPTPSIEENEQKGTDQEQIKMSIQFGAHNVEIFDELSYNFALQMLKAIKKELQKRGIRFDVNTM